MADDKTYREALEEAAPRLEALQMQFTAALDQVLAFWRDIEPAVRNFVAQGDKLTEQDWMDEPESTRELYEKMKPLIAEIDGQQGKK